MHEQEVSGFLYLGSPGNLGSSEAYSRRRPAGPREVPHESHSAHAPLAPRPSGESGPTVREIRLLCADYRFVPSFSTDWMPGMAGFAWQGL